MAILKFKTGNKEITLEATIEEIHQLLVKMENGHKFSQKTLPELEHIKLNKESDNWIPDTLDIMKYIEAQPDFAHSTVEIQRDVVGELFTVSQNRRRFEKLYDRITRARKRIEKKYKGKFYKDKNEFVTISSGSHYYRFKFRKNQDNDSSHPIAR